MELLLCAGVAAIMFLVVCFWSPGASARVGWLLTMGVPVWIVYEKGSCRFDSRSIVGLLAIAVVFLKPSRFRFPGFSWFDLLPFAVLISAGLSIAINQKLGPTGIAALFIYWVGPYLLGRLIIANDQDLKKLLPYASIVITLIAFSMFLESILDVNVWNEVLKHKGSVQGDFGHRAGLKRAEGGFGHPIHAGMFLALSLPWTLAQSLRSIRGEATMYWVLCPLIVAVGVFSSLSRGPIMLYATVILGVALYYIPQIRWPTVYVGCVLFAVVSVLMSSAVELAEKVEDHDKIVIEVDGKLYNYSSARHRYLLFLVYREPITKAGWIGLGKWWDSLDHVNMIDPDLRIYFKSVDNHYLLHFLETGVIGSILFLMLPVGLMLAFYVGSKSGALQRVLSPESILFMVAMVSSVAGAAVILVTVFLAYAFSFAFLLNMGCIISLLVYARSGNLPPPTRLPSRLSPTPMRKASSSTDPRYSNCIQ